MLQVITSPFNHCDAQTNFDSLNMAMERLRNEEREYIYCIVLPFQPSSPSVVVAKVGITKNPAERFYDIFHAFEVFGEPQPLLKKLPEDDNPTEWAKSIDEIIFIHEVRNPGTAEKDIRTQLIQKSVIHFYQPELKSDFRDSFTAKVPKEKKDYLKSVGMTEWIILDHSLAMSLQKIFRAGRICQLRCVPSGIELSRALKDCCFQVSRGKVPTSLGMIIAGGVDQGLPLWFEFKALEFKHKLSTIPVPIQNFDD